MKTKDMLVLALLAATLFAAGLILWPIFILLPSPALRALILAPLYAVVGEVLLCKVNYRGALLMFAVVMGFILTVFAPLLLPVSILAGLMAELSGFIGGKITGKSPWQQHPHIRGMAASLFPTLQFPLMLHAWAMATNTGILIHPLLVVVLTMVGFFFGFLGALVGRVVTKKLSSAKKIEPAEPPMRHTGE